ncbi:hypothetical protein C8Q75DRAFT_758816 [Abortiporus biennis]|nr:hypothetical protein C8Q75DRAFT_758816 [Abortiporus biennis]
MKPTSFIVLCALGISTSASASSWFGSGDSADKNPSPSQWSADQYDNFQRVFSNIKSDAFDSWDESRLREFLLEQGVVEPSGTREQLVLLAKQRYDALSSVASSYSASVSSLASQASGSASSFASQASAGASTAVYGDTKSQASKSVVSYYAQATDDARRKLEDSKDYVYSTWDDNQLRSYLVQKGVIKSKQQATRDELLAKMKETYVKTASPVWQAWSDSYIRDWLVDHGVVKTDTQKTRDQLVADMNNYYYDTKDYVYSTWSDNQIRSWLISHNVIKSDAQIQREKLQKLIADNYVNARDTVWESWSDSDMKSWLTEHGYLKTDGQKKRDELVKMMNDKYNDYSARTAPYLVWPDARLRAYLRESGISEDALPTSRPGLLQEVRIRYVQTTHRADDILSKIRDAINNGVGVAEEKIATVLDMLTGYAETAKTRGYETYSGSKAYAGEKYDDTKSSVSSAGSSASSGASSTASHASSGAGSAASHASSAGSSVGSSASSVGSYATDTAKEAVKSKGSEYDSAGRKYWNEKVEEAKRAADQAKVEL